MTSPSAGIQQLLAAEKKAADKVGEARKRKWIQKSWSKNDDKFEKDDHVIQKVLKTKIIST